MGVGGKAVAGQLAINFRAAGFRMFELFDDDHAGASPMTKPSRSRSNGREARSVRRSALLSAFIEENPARPIGMIEASAPPARKMSASPNLMMRHDSPIALFEGAHAVTMQKFGPCKQNSSR